MALSWDGARDFLRREAERDHALGALPRPLLIAFRGEEARALGFCRQPRPSEPDLAMALFELAQFAQLTRPDRLLCAIAATLRPLAVEPLFGRLTGARALAVQTATRSGRKVEEAALLLPYGLEDDGSLRWEESVRVAEAVPTDLRRTLRAALVANPARPCPDLGAVGAMLVRWGHLIAVAPGVMDEVASPYAAWDDDNKST